MGSEDCLYLNVYTPTVPAEGMKLLKPVMVFVHGGAFILGSGNADMLGPEYLLINDVVVVTFNYRLGLLGEQSAQFFLGLQHDLFRFSESRGPIVEYPRKCRFKGRGSGARVG